MDFLGVNADIHFEKSSCADVPLFILRNGT